MYVDVLKLDELSYYVFFVVDIIGVMYMYMYMHMRTRTRVRVCVCVCICICICICVCVCVCVCVCICICMYMYMYMYKYMQCSSAYMMNLNLSLHVMISLMYIVNKRGPSVDPWGTPVTIFTLSDGFHYCILCNFDLVRQSLVFAFLLFNYMDTLYMYVCIYIV